MEEIKFIFIVLHYNQKALKDTFECIESLEKIGKDTSYKIIIIENGSNDSSAEKILEKYKDNLNVECIISEKNLGFAKGNNLGCDYAKKKYNPDYLIVLNNDTYILQEDFLVLLEEIYKKKQFDILGPYIYDKNFQPQNPVLNLKTKIEEIELELDNIEKVLSLNPLKENLKNKIKMMIFSQKYLEKWMRKIFNKPKIEELQDEKISNQILENVGLHGSCLIFSRKYIKKYKEIFYSKTFMYVEEDILYNRVLKDRLKSLYHPSLKIYHKEDKSTEATIGTKFEKQIFILKNIKESLKIYKEVLLNGE